MEAITNQHPHGIVLHEIYFDKISYNNLVPVGIPMDAIKDGELELRVGRACVGLGDDLFVVTLKLTGYAEGVFNFTVECSGRFKVPSDLAERNEKGITQRDILSTSCLAMLFPFARQKAMSLTNDGDYNITIQPFSVHDFFKDEPAMEIVYLENPYKDNSDLNVHCFLEEISTDPDPSSNPNPEVRTEIIQALYEVEDHIRRRDLDGHIVLSNNGFDLLSQKLYQMLHSHGMISSVDKKVGYHMINIIMESVHIQIEFILFNDSERNDEPAYVIYKKRKDGSIDE